MEGRFQGFSSSVIDFLWNLRMNNHKQWMDENRQWYEQALKKPMDEFGIALAEEVSRFGEDFFMKPVASRMNRDMRFAKDKSPYRACKWVVLRPQEAQGPWKDKPTFFFEIAPEGYTYGMGFYQAKVEYMKNFRKRIEANPEEMLRLAKDLKKQTCFSVDGENYKRKMTDIEEPLLQEWCQKKTFAFLAKRPIEDALFSEELPDKVAEDFKVLVPFYRYLQAISAE
ncbi:MAG: DUF2461 domain-containing protein [Epulopiscium sp.]|jgi:uncharacterized protein (TIGR02453 family)|nr:DUF2461 domain-containing protein [Candidatus Epulonipiscium sp.]